uniref:UBX domain-containing protein n=1 Tax=Macrostomum lignano TaxID=282301 RepID=A0A1I8HK68_9PLAT
MLSHAHYRLADTAAPAMQPENGTAAATELDEFGGGLNGAGGGGMTDPGPANGRLHLRLTLYLEHSNRNKYVYCNLNAVPSIQQQWARILLVVEQTFTRQECQAHQESYSQLLQDGRRALVVRWKSEDDENNNLLGRKRRVVSAEQKIVEDQELRREMETSLMNQSAATSGEERAAATEAGSSTPVQC